MIDQDKIDKITSYMKARHKEFPFLQYKIYDFLKAYGFEGDRFLSPNAKNMETRTTNGKISSYLYFYENRRFNISVALCYNKNRGSASASIEFKDYGITIERIPFGKLVKIIKMIAE